MNSALVLIVLLLAVPLQLFLTHYINTSYASSSSANSATAGPDSMGSEGQDAGRGIDTVRMEAFHRQVNRLCEIGQPLVNMYRNCVERICLTVMILLLTAACRSM